jgi:hypothetical protein
VTSDLILTSDGSSVSFDGELVLELGVGKHVSWLIGVFGW